LGGFATDLEWGHLARTDSALDIPSNFIMMVANLYNYTQDSELLGYLPACQKAVGCLLNKTGVNRLVIQEAGQDWMDKWSRSGIVTYTNVLYYKALIDLASLERAAGEIAEAIFTQSLLPIGQSALYFCTLYIILYVLFLGLSLASTRRERRSIRSIIIRKSLFTILISFCAMLAGLFTLYFFLFAP
jgi:hypothetical protein